MKQFSYKNEEQEEMFPKKTKQMGGLENQLKIYMEDYVYTYLYQYGKSENAKEKVAALVGRYMVIDGQNCLLISGAIQGKGSIQQNASETFTEETWEYIGSQLQQYFQGLSVVGWVHLQPSFGAFLMAKDEVFHSNYFTEEHHVLFVLDVLDKLDTFYIYNEDQKGLRQARGYFIYYDKNTEMQEYMLENTLLPSKTAPPEDLPIDEDGDSPLLQHRADFAPDYRIDAAKKIREVLNRRAEEVERVQRKRYTLLTSVSCTLCVVTLCMGYTLFNSLSRLQNLEGEILNVQNSYYALEESVQDVRVQTTFATETPQTVPQEPVQESTQPTPTTTVWHTVENGETLSTISRIYYGDGEGVTKIMTANNLGNPDFIFIGQALLIPE